MSNIGKKKLLKFQQGELNAVLLYQRLSKKTKDDALRPIYLELAAEEGKHAAILKKITETKLKPKARMAKLVLFMVKIFGERTVLKNVVKVEMKASKAYEKFTKDYPSLQEIVEDEAKHHNILKKHL